MTRILLLLGFIGVLASCKPGVPKDIIQPAEMENLLYDIHLIDGYAGVIPTQDSAMKVVPPMYKAIYKKYGTDSAKHAQSMAYYYKHPDVLLKMYDKIADRLNKAKDKEVEAQQKKGLKREKMGNQLVE